MFARKVSIYFGTICFLFLCPQLLTASGDLDSTFGNSGKVVTDVLGANNSFVNDLALQPDGKLVLAGVTYLRGRGYRAVLARLLENGSLDISFGNEGYVIPDLNESSSLNSVIIQPDGKIIAGGVDGDAIIARFNNDGTPDLTFKNDGVKRIAIEESTYVYDLALQSDGKIVAAGKAGYCDFPWGCYYSFLVLRLKQDGSFDSSFGNGGKIIKGDMNTQAAHCVALQTDGKIVVSGSLMDEDFFTIRLRPNGKFDDSFGINGQVITDFNSGIDEAKSIAIQEDGRIITAGTTRQLPYATSNQLSIARYMPDGNLDFSFGNQGKLITNFGEYTYFGSMQLRSDGRIFIAAFTDSDWKLLQYTSSGVLDVLFGTGGIVYTDFLQSPDQAIASLILENGSMVVAGSAGTPDHSDFAAARFDSTGNLDSIFGDQGKIIIPSITSSSDQLSAEAVLQPDGKILIAGSERPRWWGNPGPLLVRYLPTGELDTTFGNEGKTTQWHGPPAEIDGVALQQDGRIVTVGGYEEDCFAARYTNDGLLDATFGFQGISRPITDCNFCGIQLKDVVLQTDGKIVAAGRNNSDAIVAVRWNTDGSLDTSFGSDGIATFPLGVYVRAWGITIQPDGKMIIVGSGDDNNNDTIHGFIVIRFDSNGNLDATFGTAGIVMTNIPSGDSAAYDVAIQSDGKIVATGITESALYSDIVLVRYLNDGSVDLGFGSHGIVLTDFFGGSDWPSAITIQEDGKILVGGGSFLNISQFALARYESNGLLDYSFGIGGKVTTEFDGSYAGCTDIAIQADQKILALGITNNGQGTGDFALARYSVSSITLQPSSLQPMQIGQPFSENLIANGGTEPYTYSLVSGELPPGISLSLSGVLSGTPTTSGIYTFTIRATDANSLGGTQAYLAALFLLIDDFEDGILTWDAPARHWTESGGSLIGTGGWAIARRPWTPSGASSCSICTMEAELKTSSGSFSKLAVIGWYQDRENYVALTMDETNQNWIFEQRSGGKIVDRVKSYSWIGSDVFYHVKLQFDGTNFYVFINNALLVTKRARTAPFGNFGFRVRNTTGYFQEIKVY